MMDIVKKNLISIICGVVALAAVAVAFTVLTGKAGELQTQLDARKGVHDQLSKLLSSPRQLPVIDEKAEPEKLLKFPNEKTIKQGEVVAQAIEAESKNLLKEAVKLNQHIPLEPGSLPEPASVSAYNFRERYQKYFSPAAANGANPNEALKNSQFIADLNAGLPPSAEEIRLEQEKQSKEIRTKRSQFLPNGQTVNEAAVTSEITERTRKLPDEMRAQVAEHSKVYINPMTFTPWQPILGQAGQPAPADIYTAQLMLWLQQDVVAAVNDANQGAKNIRDAAVKHLVRVTVNPHPILPTGAATPAIDPDAPVPTDKAISPTGRVSNGMYDVFHLLIEADIDAARLPDFLRSIGKNRFMTPLWVDVKSIDNAIELAAGHDYGSTPMVNVKVQCEDLYLRQWNRPLMPGTIRVLLGLPPVEEVKPADAAATAGTPAAATPAEAAPAATTPTEATTAPATSAPSTPAPATATPPAAPAAP